MFSILYYSATGNTEYLANNLKEQLGLSCTELNNISKIDVKKMNRGEHLVLMYSIHAFNAPKEMIEFVKQIPDGIFERVSIIAVGCHHSWLNSANSTEVKKILAQKGYEVYIDRILVMPLTIVVNLGNDVNTATIKESTNQLVDIKNDLIKEIKDVKEIPFKSKVMTTVGKVEKHAAKLFGAELSANQACISCGKCWDECPSQNIYPNQLQKPKFKLNCSMCMKCIYNCPVKAINPRISKFLPLKNGYSVKDYIETI